MRLVVLMAGDSAVFEVAGHKYPKNLVEIDGEPLVQRVVDGLRPLIERASGAVFLVREEENRRHHTGEVIRLLAPEAEVVGVPVLSSGAACTALHAISHIGRDEPLVIFNGDQVLEADLGAVTAGFEADNLDGGVVTFDAVHPRWSYVRTGPDGLVMEAAEKRPISRLATAGTYWVRQGGDFIDGAMAMIRKDASVEGSFYVCPVYNELILRGLRIGTHHIERDRYFSLASLHGVNTYEEHLARARRASLAVAA
jgi:CTP:molybdopterin cytidylyltransferase MocA